MLQKKFALYIRRQDAQLTIRCNASHGESHTCTETDTYVEQNKQTHFNIEFF